MASRTRDLDVTDAKKGISLTWLYRRRRSAGQERLRTGERRERGDQRYTPKHGGMGTFSRAKNDTWGIKKVLTDSVVQEKFHTKYIEIHRVNHWAAGARAYSGQDLRDFLDRDDVTPGRLLTGLTLRGGASAIASLSISAELRKLVVPPRFLEGFDPAASLAEECLCFAFALVSIGTGFGNYGRAGGRGRRRRTGTLRVASGGRNGSR